MKRIMVLHIGRDYLHIQRVALGVDHQLLLRPLVPGDTEAVAALVGDW